MFLFGKRNNPPAKGYYFVPGGRIFKEETIKEAFERISNGEIGKKLNIENAIFLGVYEHFYKNSFFTKNISTHYVVLAYKIKIEKLDKLYLPKEQHSEYIWLKKEEILENDKVHYYCKQYFL